MLKSLCFDRAGLQRVRKKSMMCSFSEERGASAARKARKFNGALDAAEKVDGLLFRRERRALALRIISKLERALAPGFLCLGHKGPFSILFSRRYNAFQAARKLFFAIFLSKIECQALTPTKNPSNSFPTIHLARKRKVRISYVPLSKLDIEGKRKIRNKVAKESPENLGLRALATQSSGKDHRNSFAWTNLAISPLFGRI